MEFAPLDLHFHNQHTSRGRLSHNSRHTEKPSPRSSCSHRVPSSDNIPRSRPTDHVVRLLRGRGLVTLWVDKSADPSLSLDFGVGPGHLLEFADQAPPLPNLPRWRDPDSEALLLPGFLTRDSMSPKKTIDRCLFPKCSEYSARPRLHLFLGLTLHPLTARPGLAPPRALATKPKSGPRSKASKTTSRRTPRANLKARLQNSGWRAALFPHLLRLFLSHLRQNQAVLLQMPPTFNKSRLSI